MSLHCLARRQVLSTLAWDPKSNALVGLGYQIVNGTFVRTINSYQPSTKTWKQLSTVTQYLVSCWF